jgi:preprotein translocase subunit SecA
VVFDYLRDRMALGLKRAKARRLMDEFLGGQSRPLLFRGLFFAIIDEADSILIDEAKTPLILSQNVDSAKEEHLYRAALNMARQLDRDVDFRLSARSRAIELTAEGKARMLKLAPTADVRRDEPLWRSPRALEEMVGQALSALHLFDLDRHYIVADGKVQIVDEYTGRVMADRSWERGLHQMIEVKEGCEMTAQRRVQARITYQRFFRRYLKLCGMSGTVSEAAGELHAVYGLRVMKIPPHRSLRRRHLGTTLHQNADHKWRQVIERAQEVTQAGRPLLIGTRSVAASEAVSERLTAAGLSQHAVLNARQDRAEAEIVAQAGQPSRITVATNIAGRGTDIRLAPQVVEVVGLHVILTEFHDSARIDRQLYGRCARQGDPGSVEAIVSLEDELFQHFLGTFGSVIRRFGGAKQGELLRRWAQYRAERQHARTRLDTMAQDRRLEKQLAFAGSGE